MDILPTFLEISNSTTIDDRILDGLSLKNTLHNLDKSERKKIIYYREREIYAIRHGDFKAHFITKGAYNYPEKTEKIILGKPLLYNLNIDPSEKFNVANENPEILKKIFKIKQDHENNLNAPENLLKHRGLK